MESFMMKIGLATERHSISIDFQAYVVRPVHPYLRCWKHGAKLLMVGLHNVHKYMYVHVYQLADYINLFMMNPYQEESGAETPSEIEEIDTPTSGTFIYSPPSMALPTSGTLL